MGAQFPAPGLVAHAGGVLQDATLGNQTADGARTVFAAKHMGGLIGGAGLLSAGPQVGDRLAADNERWVSLLLHITDHANENPPPTEAAAALLVDRLADGLAGSGKLCCGQCGPGRPCLRACCAGGGSLCYQLGRVGGRRDELRVGEFTSLAKSPPHSSSAASLLLLCPHSRPTHVAPFTRSP